MPVRQVIHVLASAAGGTARYAAMLAAGCAEHGLTVTVCGAAGRPEPAGADAPAGAAPADGTAPGPPVRFVPLTIGARPRPGRDAAAVRRLRGLLAAADPDLLHAHGLRAGTIAALAVRPPFPASGRPGGRPALVVTVHNDPPGSAAARAVYRLLERIVARRADAVQCVSADLAERMRRRGARRVSLAVVAAAGRPPRARAARLVRAGIAAPGQPLLVAAGRLTEQKGFGTLLAAAARWRDRTPPPALVIAGDGPLADRLAAQARRLGVTAVFTGHRDDLPDLLAAADVVIVPSRWEGQSLVLQEALAAGRPVVASRAGAIPAVVGDAALLVPPGEAAALADAVLAVLDDPGLAARLRAAALARAERLPAPADAVRAVLVLYEELLATG